MRQPNIVWSFPDERRHASVGRVGNPVIRTPHLDLLVGRGTACTSAYCESPVRQSSRVSVLNVSSPREHGKVQNGWPSCTGGDPLPAGQVACSHITHAVVGGSRGRGEESS